ncbi:MAG: hypothetical protein Kow0062_08440 [Acidobacteriota bacterium]
MARRDRQPDLPDAPSPGSERTGSGPGQAGTETVLVRTRSGESGWACAEAAGDDLARVPLPEGWEITLDIVSGPQSGRSFRVTRPRMILGRGGADLPIDDAHVSRRHASIEVYGAACVLLKDLGSTNGTLVNGTRVVAAELQDGDTIEIGTTRIAVTIGTPP